MQRPDRSAVRESSADRSSFDADYVEALTRHLDAAGEQGLERANQLGRRALEAGLSTLDLVGTHLRGALGDVARTRHQPAGGHGRVLARVARRVRDHPPRLRRVPSFGGRSGPPGRAAARAVGCLLDDRRGTDDPRTPRPGLCPGAAVPRRRRRSTRVRSPRTASDRRRPGRGRRDGCRAGGQRRSSDPARPPRTHVER